MVDMPINLLVKPASGHCNMQCKYCFYVDEMKSRSFDSLDFMTEETLYHMLEKTFQYTKSSVSIAFQGGEPTLVGLAFYEKVIELVKILNINQCPVSYSLQTNGYRLDEKWAIFFKKHNFLLGISLDGSKRTHDKYRVSNDRGTFDVVIQSVNLMKKYDVPFNILTVIHKDITQNVKKTYEFFQKNRLDYQQYIECLQPLGAPDNEVEHTLSVDDYGDFLIELFDLWYADFKNKYYVSIRYFDNLVGMYLKKSPETCAMMGVCGSYFVIEADGSAYPCDFYVLDQWKLGNLNVNTIEQLQEKRKDLQFIEHSFYTPDGCKKCKWYVLCRNGCRRNCEPTNDKMRMQNHFCGAYKRFFEHTHEKLEEVAQVVYQNNLLK